MEKLGPIWAEEIFLYFQAFHECGKDWGSIALKVPGRTPAMCQALYKMNKAYLTLPEDNQSGPGLAALMADAYARDGEVGESSEELLDAQEEDVSPERRSSSRRSKPSAKAEAAGVGWLAEETAAEKNPTSAGGRRGSRSAKSSGRGKVAPSPLSATVDDDDELGTPAKRRKRKRELFPDSPGAYGMRHRRKSHTTAKQAQNAAMDVLSAAAVNRPTVSTHGLDSLLAAMGAVPTGASSDEAGPSKPAAAAAEGELRGQGEGMRWALSQAGLVDLGSDKLDAVLGLHHLLSSRKGRRWCMYEWFCSTIDQIYFETNEFQALLNELNLYRITRLTRTEWSYIRSKMGKPRRLSPAYLLQELQKLRMYRDEVRAHHSGKAGHQAPPPEIELCLDEIPAPINVGTPVVARQPKDGELYAGKVLLKDGHRYRVQFDDASLGQPLLIEDVHVMAMTGSPPSIWRRKQPREGADQAQGYTREAQELAEKKQAVLHELSAAIEPEKRGALEQEAGALEEQLRALHAHVAQMQRHMPNQQLAPSLLAEQCLAAARQLVGEEWAKQEAPVPEGATRGDVSEVQELLAGCLASLFGLHDTARRPLLDIQQVLNHVLAKVKPSDPNIMPEYMQIDAVVNAMASTSANQVYVAQPAMP